MVVAAKGKRTKTEQGMSPLEHHSAYRPSDCQQHHNLFTSKRHQRFRKIKTRDPLKLNSIVGRCLEPGENIEREGQQNRDTPESRWARGWDHDLQKCPQLSFRDAYSERNLHNFEWGGGPFRQRDEKQINATNRNINSWREYHKAVLKANQRVGKSIKQGSQRKR